MKLVKSDKNYKYYELSEKEQDDSMYWNSEVVAISKEDLKYCSPKDCLNDGDVKSCEYDYVKDTNSIIGEYVLVKSSIKVIEEEL